jgi:hypothetical protein
MLNANLPMAEYRCVICEQSEARCRCDVKDFCVLCQGAEDVRLCEDGQYYCRICREICDYHAEY